MKKYSYPFLFAATISFLIVVFLFIVWKREIYQITFLRVSTNRCMIVSAMVLSLFISLYFINKGAVKSNKYIDYLKFYGGACVSLLFIFLIPIITITYLVRAKRPVIRSTILTHQEVTKAVLVQMLMILI